MLAVDEVVTEEIVACTVRSADAHVADEREEPLDLGGVNNREEMVFECSKLARSARLRAAQPRRTYDWDRRPHQRVGILLLGTSMLVHVLHFVSIENALPMSRIVRDY